MLLVLLFVVGLQSHSTANALFNINKKYHNISFNQEYNGLKVIDSRLYIKMNKQYDVLVFGLDVFSDIDIAVDPLISFDRRS